MFHLHYSVLLIWTIFQDFLFLATKDLHSKKKAYCIYIILYLSSVHSACLIADLLVCPSLGRADRTISAAAFTERKKSHLWLARLKVSAESGVVVLRHRRFMVSVVSEFSGHWSHLAKALILSSVISVNLCLHPTATITTFHIRTVCNKPFSKLYAIEKNRSKVQFQLKFSKEICRDCTCLRSTR